MKARKWTGEQKMKIVLEGLKEKISLSELCNQHQISMAQYYKWRDRLMKDGAKIFEYGGIDRSEERLLAENRRLKEAIGDLTMELKKKRFLRQKRNRSMKRKQEDNLWRKRIEAIKSEHPAWGCRRVWAYLKYREGDLVNQKRIYRIMMENKLLIEKNAHLRATGAPYRSKPQADRPNQIYGIDMTKIKVKSWGWVYLVVVLDWYSKKIVGYDLSHQSKTSDWLRALDKALKAQFPNGINNDAKKLKLVSDNGCQPTSTQFMAACSVLNIKQIFASFNNPKGNADTERVIKTIKEDLVWPRDWTTPFELQNALDARIENYNTDYPHSGLNYQTPIEAEANYKNSPSLALT